MDEKTQNIPRDSVEELIDTAKMFDLNATEWEELAARAEKGNQQCFASYSAKAETFRFCARSLRRCIKRISTTPQKGELYEE